MSYETLIAKLEPKELIGVIDRLGIKDEDLQALQNALYARLPGKAARQAAIIEQLGVERIAKTFHHSPELWTGLIGKPAIQAAFDKELRAVPIDNGFSATTGTESDSGNEYSGSWSWTVVRSVKLDPIEAKNVQRLAYLIDLAHACDLSLNAAAETAERALQNIADVFFGAFPANHEKYKEQQGGGSEKAESLREKTGAAKKKLDKPAFLAMALELGEVMQRVFPAKTFEVIGQPLVRFKEWQDEQEAAKLARIDAVIEKAGPESKAAVFNDVVDLVLGLEEGDLAPRLARIREKGAAIAFLSAATPKLDAGRVATLAARLT